MERMPLPLFGMLFFAQLCGCPAGTGEGLDETGRPVGEAESNAPLNVTFSSIQDNVFTPLCTTCHAGASAPLGLRLDAANSFALLVGVSSEQVPDLFRVAPNDPDNSYLVQKLEGTAAVGAQMPLGSPALDQDTLNIVRQWIADGALPDQDRVPSDTPPIVVSLSPLPNSSLDSLPAQIFAVFDREMDASTIDATSFSVERSGGDDGFEESNEVTLVPDNVTLSAINPTLAILDLHGVDSLEDTYRVTLRGTGSMAIRNISGIALDGEFSNSFPSGDGLAGGDFRASFVVAGIQPNLESIQKNVFTPFCAGCHSGPTGPVLPGGMDLSELNASFSSLVDVPSIEVPGLMRVTSGNVNNSYLIQKLEGTAAVGGQMPLGEPPLSQETIDTIRSWIENGSEW